MRNTFINVSADKALKDQSPIPVFVWVVCYVITSLVATFDLMFLVIILVEFVVCQILFQYHPRTVYLTMKFLVTHYRFTPNHEDEEYIYDEYSIEGLREVLPELVGAKKASFINTKGEVRSFKDA